MVIFTGGQFVAGRCLYSNEVDNVKDSFLRVKHRPSFSKLIQLKMPPVIDCCFDSLPILYLTNVIIHPMYFHGPQPQYSHYKSLVLLRSHL